MTSQIGFVLVLPGEDNKLDSKINSLEQQVVVKLQLYFYESNIVDF